jgi:plastocyanin
MHSNTLSGFALGLLLVATACGGGQQAPAESTDAPAGAPTSAPVDESTAGNITGKVSFEGTPPKNEPIKMNADPACVKAASGPQAQETYMVGGGGELQNVFVYVKDGLGDRTFTAPTGPVVLDQKGCRYHPHVFGIMVGQPMQILNSDPTLHNIHATPAAGQNAEFNTGQPIQGMKTDHTFTKKEVMVPFKCDVHGWMNAYVGVLDHPYFATTGGDGAFALNKLPPGTYTIEAWHEKLGTQTQSVTIGPKESKEITFTFKGGATTD